MATLRGVDASHWNYDDGFRPSQIANEASFLIVKATGGTGYVDPTCDKMVQEAKSLGMGFGFYHFANDSCPGTARKEAEHFLRACENYFGDGTPVLDWETKNVSVDWVNEFVRIVHDETKVWPWVYSTPSYFQSGDVEKNCGRWVARYGKNNLASINATPDPRLINGVPGTVAAWQYSSVGKVGGYRGNLDLDIFYGSREQWKAYAKGDRVFEENPPLIPDDRSFPIVVENESYKVMVEKK